jgi:hypothetical protein
MTTDGWRRAALVLALQAGLAGASAAEQTGAASPTAGPVYLQVAPVVTVHTEGEQYHRASTSAARRHPSVVMAHRFPASPDRAPASYGAQADGTT